MRKPNVVFVFADQWRGQATGYAGDPNARTPHLDRLAAEGVNMTNAIAGCPVCSPYRASLLTGQYPLTHGVFINDSPLSDKAVSIAEACADAGYRTAYIGKWHVDGHGRSEFIPRQRRQGFQFWKVLECTHNYNESKYYGDENRRLTWDGYDAIAQTREAQAYLRSAPADKPFVLFLSWGPPHAPYQTAPEQYRRRFRPEDVKLRPNVPADCAEKARQDLAGYYAHIAALDDCVGRLRQTLRETGLDENTIFVFTSDHGDMLGSHGQQKKQQPYEESVSVPYLIRLPGGVRAGKAIDMPFDAPDTMPTLLGLCGVKVPDTVEGVDFSPVLLGKAEPCIDSVILTCPAPFGQWERKVGGREYRGVRTRRHTYVRSLDGPWLLFDNQADPHQLDNLCGRSEHAGLQKEMEALLAARLKQTGDEFLPAEAYIRKWGYKVNANGTMPYTT